MPMQKFYHGSAPSEASVIDELESVVGPRRKLIVSIPIGERENADYASQGDQQPEEAPEANDAQVINHDHLYGEVTFEFQLTLLRDLLPPALSDTVEGQMARRRALKASRRMTRYRCDIEDVLTHDQLDHVLPLQRPKERSLREVVNLVAQWRHLCSGVYIEAPEGGRALKKFELREAAGAIGVSKKTLDDYQKQIQIGLAHDFDFMAHQASMVRVLRQYNVGRSYRQRTGLN